MRWLFYFLILIIGPSAAFAQKKAGHTPQASCNNFDFESGFSGWGGFAWNFVSTATFVTTPTAPYHKITTAGFDNIIAPLSTLAPAGGTQSAMIGFATPGSQEYWINQTFVVSATDPVYVYQSAVVFKDLDQFSPPHSAAQQNYFEVLFTDQTGDTIPCGYSKVLVSQATPANGFQSYIYVDPNQSPPNNQIPHLWKDWTSTAVDLTAYIGTNVTVRFRAHSCALGDHYTYAYIDGYCEPAVSNNTTLTICQGSTVTLNGPTGFTGYTWLPGGQTTQDIQTGTAGSYTVTATGQAGCILVKTYSVIVNPAPAIFANPTNVNICTGNSTTLTGSSVPASGISFSWTPSTALSPTTGISVVASPTSSVTYTVVGTDGNGCSNAATVAVNVGQFPVAVVADQTICPGNTATLTASGGGSYLWNTGGTSSSISVNPTSASSYTVIVANSAGCSDTAVANVFMAPPIIPVITNATICSGQTTTLTASGGTNYSWNTGQTTSSITAAITTGVTYTVIVTDANGCSGPGIASVSVAPSPVVTVSSSTICSGQTATLTASGGGNYSWNTGPTTSSITTTAAATYSVLVTNSNGCTSSGTGSVSVLPLPTSSINGITTICSGQSTMLSAAGTGNYLWNTGQTSSSITVSPTATGTYSVTVSNSCGTSTSAVNVTVNPLPAASAGNNVTICPGGSTFLTASGTGNYVWNTGASTVSIIVSPTITTTYTVTASNSCGSSSSPVTVTIGNSLVASVSGNIAICIGNTATLSASGGTIFSWSTGATSNTIAVTPSATASYFVIVTSGTCTDTATITVTVSPPPVAVSGNAVICQGEIAQLSASGGGTYLWSTGATTSSISVSSAGNYSVVVSANGCSDSASATVTVNPNPTANTGNNVIITQGQSATLTASGGGTYAWSNGSADSTLVVSPTLSTGYCVTVTNGNGCIDTSCVMVIVEPLDCSKLLLGEVFLPNAFSPNGDGENESIKIYFGDINCIKTFNLLIYNRWGEKVFEANAPVAEWDGSYKGNPEESGVFAYYLNVVLYNNDEIKRSGNLSLIR